MKLAIITLLAIVIAGEWLYFLALLLKVPQS
jgi:hypothetical protein